MNWILLDEERRLEGNIYRLNTDQSNHILTILKKSEPGSKLRGLLPELGQGTIQIESWEENIGIVSFSLDPSISKILNPISLILPLPRPQTGKKILHLAGCFGVKNTIFYLPESKNKEYLTSPIYKPDSMEKEIHSGMEQSGSFIKTKVSLLKKNLKHTLESLDELLIYSFDPSGIEIWTDWLYKSPGHSPLTDKSIGLVFGSESGFKPEEVDFLKDETNCFQLGSRILRTEYAVSSVLYTVDSYLESVRRR